MIDPFSYSICSVSRDSSADVAMFLAAAARLEPAPDGIVIVDSGSSDSTPREVRRHAPARIPVTLEALDENVGFAAGMNRAVSLTQTPWVLALNLDCLPEPGFAGHLLARAQHSDEVAVAAVTGRLRRFEEAGVATKLDACGMFLSWSWRHHDRGSDEEDRGQHSAPEAVFGASGAAVLLRREALEDAAVDGDPFATEFHSFREDAELAFRLRERGWEVLYEPLATAAHRRSNLPARRRKMPAHVNYHSLKNRYLLRAYHQTFGNLLLTLIPTLFRDLLALGYVVAAERTSLGAYRWLWLHRSEILRKRRILRARRTAPAAAVNRWFWRRSRPA